MSPEHQKLIPWSNLADWAREQQERGGEQQNAWVQCHGVFDLLHIGHIRYFQRAKQLGDFLIVTVTPDRFVNKGPNRPAFSEQLRAAALAALDCVDAVVITDSPTAIESLELIRPRIYAKGVEFQSHLTPELQSELQQCEQSGIQVEYIEDEVTSSSSELLNRFLSPFPAETTPFLEQFRTRYTWQDFEDVFQAVSNLKVTVIGDSLIDEIYECESLAQSARAPIVTTRYRSHQQYSAGASAIAGHLNSFCKQVKLITLGQRELEPLLISPGSSQPNLEIIDPTQGKLKAPIKRRYRESYFSVPMFEINFNEPVTLSEEQQQSCLQSVEQAIDESDLVLIWDQAFGLLQSDFLELFNREHARNKLALCISHDPASRGTSLFETCRQARFVQLGEKEFRNHSTGNNKELEQQVLDWLELARHQQLVLTRGQHGCWAIDDTDREIHPLPSLATQIVDRTGAQEAFFTLSALASTVEAPLELAAFLGNLAGAQSVSQVSTEHFLQPDSLRRHLKSLWK